MKRRILTSSCSRFAYCLVANHRELHVRVEPRRKPIGCVFWPIAYFVSFDLRVPAAGFRPDALVVVTRFAVGAGFLAVLAAGAGASAGTLATCRCETALRRGMCATARLPFVSSLTPMVRWLVRCLMKKARPIARGCTRF